MADDKAECQVCHRFFCVTSAGVIRAHGPVSNRCPGSHSSLSSLQSDSLSSSSSGSTPRCGSPVMADNPTLAEEIRPKISIIKRIPRNSRHLASSKFCSLLEAVVRDNSRSSWVRLLSFPARCLFNPRRGGKRWSLSSLVNKQLEQGSGPSDSHVSSFHRHSAGPTDPANRLKAEVSSRLEEGDIRGAIRLASSDSGIAKPTIATFHALQDKHPPSPPDFSPPTPPLSSDYPSVSESEVYEAIMSFPPASSGGPDGLRPQHLKDMLFMCTTNHRDSPLLSALASFTSLVLEGSCPASVRQFFFGARLIALDKEGGGVRPIAVGCCLRRLAAKVACRRVVKDMALLLSPRQLGVGVQGGVEATIHAAREYISSLNTDDHDALIKLDFKNAFNTLRRDRMLHSVKDLCPDIFPFVFSVYHSSSFLFWEDKQILSAEGVQQGDPLGPLLFCLTLHQFLVQLKSPLCIGYLDDVSLGGSTKTLMSDMAVIRKAEDIGLILNSAKSEIISSDSNTSGQLLQGLPILLLHQLHSSVHLWVIQSVSHLLLKIKSISLKT